MLSIIVPTYNEKDNLRPLITRIAGALGKTQEPWEVIIVDDSSPDRTAAEAKRLSKRFRIRTIVRPGKRGLSSAVLDGIRAARGQCVAVMDADLSHPPEALPDMLEQVASGHDLVVGSRYMERGRIVDWSWKRRVISRGAVLLARPLGPFSDPVSGFLMFRKAVLRGARLNASGFKIGLEIIARGSWRSGAEVEYVFSPRLKGESKMGLAVMGQYAWQLVRLYVFKVFGQMVR